MSCCANSARVGFLPEEIYFFRDSGRNMEETISSSFFRNKWKKVEVTRYTVANLEETNL